MAGAWGQPQRALEAVLLDGQPREDGGWISCAVGRDRHPSPEVAKMRLKEAPHQSFTNYECKDDDGAQALELSG